ncbi:DUF2795 domain-containing protein [Leifsonia williamsii]|uniref:DUF2795 domain-containing protein n=1 Tax=Leifsonia williamsii TaxID=3035919 RepID=UPI0034320DDD
MAAAAVPLHDRLRLVLELLVLGGTVLRVSAFHRNLLARLVSVCGNATEPTLRRKALQGLASRGIEGRCGGKAPAERENAPQEVLDALKNLPDRTFESPVQVTEAINT